MRRRKNGARYNERDLNTQRIRKGPKKNVQNRIRKGATETESKAQNGEEVGNRKSEGNQKKWIELRVRIGRLRRGV